MKERDMIGSAKIIAMVGTARGDAARDFYRDTLGLKLREENQFAYVFDVDGVELRVSRVPALIPSTFAVLGFQVKDIEAEIDAIVAKGVTMERYGFLQQDARGVWVSPDGGAKVAWFKDPDFNVLSFVQHL
jgi:catechol 2,3-dioxygenase-like lactoylglutathione lyase family enzyme